jgi:mutator protein MutT
MMDDIPTIEVAAAVIEVDGRFLITQRTESSHLAGLWEFPGGKRRLSESLEECLRREIHEELGVEVRVGEKIETVAWNYPTRSVVLHFFRCGIERGEVAPQEGQAFRWVTPAELPTLPFPPADASLISRLAGADRLG